MTKRLSAPPMLESEGFSATSLLRKGATKTEQLNSKKSFSLRRQEKKRKRPGGRMFVLQYVQPGLAGLMHGSVSTLAPLFAAAFATHNNWKTFLVGLAASVGAGISMGFAEALSDDGSLTGRGTRCHIWSRMPGTMLSGLRQASPASWSSLSSGQSHLCAPNIWARRSRRPCSRLCLRAQSYLQLEF